MRAGSVDRFIVDLPFGLNQWHHAARHGSVGSLYAEVFREMARCCVEGGLAAVLCAKPGLVVQAVAAREAPLWQVTETRAVRFAQLHCAMLVLRRTPSPWPGDYK